MTSCAVAQGYKYAASHEWAKVEGDVATVGISDHAQVCTQARSRALKELSSTSPSVAVKVYFMSLKVPRLRSG